MKTKTMREQLIETFGAKNWKDFRRRLVEAREPFPITMSWKCIATGRRKDGRACIFEKEIEKDGNVVAAYVSEKFTYVMFRGSISIFRYMNPLDMQEKIREFDDLGVTDLEEGYHFTLEAPSTARSVEYSRERRAKISSGEHVVKPRGPNVNKRRTAIHHFRPY
jgi:hypothetical protein